MNTQAVFYSFSFLWKITIGTGAGLTSTTCLAIVSTQYKDQREQIIGLVQAAVGTGLMIGPIMGSVLYTYGGYLAPFLVVDLIYMLIYPLLAYSLTKINEEK